MTPEDRALAEFHGIAIVLLVIGNCHTHGLTSRDCKICLRLEGVIAQRLHNALRHS